MNLSSLFKLGGSRKSRRLRKSRKSRRGGGPTKLQMGDIMGMKTKGGSRRRRSRRGGGHDRIMNAIQSRQSQ